MRGLAALLGAVGCNWAFGLEPGVYKPPPDADRPDADPRADLDRDGIKDFAFGAEDMQVYFNSLLILERDDVPQL